MEKYCVTISEATKIYGIGRDFLYTLCKKQDANFVLRIGNKTLIKRPQFEAFLEQSTVL